VGESIQNNQSRYTRKTREEPKKGNINKLENKGMQPKNFFIKK
jgi:hypothetical protein